MELTLSQLLNEVNSAIKANVGGKKRLICEVVDVKSRDGHNYLTLAEYGEGGNILAKASATIWKKDASILERFYKATSLKELSGVKILVEAEVQFSPLYGISLKISNIDPTYTIGLMTQSIEQIIAKLHELDEFALNKRLQIPTIIKKVAVISPLEAAGLADFRKEADLLEKHGFMQFEYFSTKFASNNFEAAFIEVLHSIYKRQDEFDVVCIVRGGGNKADLLNLNRLKLSRACCRLPLPVIVGLGHEIDETILDKVANKTFSTPSKVAEFLYNHVVTMVKEKKDKLERTKASITQTKESYNKGLVIKASRLREKLKELVHAESNRCSKQTMSLKENVIVSGTNTKASVAKSRIEVKAGLHDLTNKTKASTMLTLAKSKDARLSQGKEVMQSLSKANLIQDRLKAVVSLNQESTQVKLSNAKEHLAHGVKRAEHDKLSKINELKGTLIRECNSAKAMAVRQLSLIKSSAKYFQLTSLLDLENKKKVIDGHRLESSLDKGFAILSDIEKNNIIDLPLNKGDEIYISRKNETTRVVVIEKTDGEKNEK